MTDTITTADKLACAKRELAMRRNAYPRWVEQNKISAGKAADEIAAMESIVRDYEDALSPRMYVHERPSFGSTECKLSLPELKKP